MIFLYPKVVIFRVQPLGFKGVHGKVEMRISTNLFHWPETWDGILDYIVYIIKISHTFFVRWWSPSQIFHLPRFFLTKRGGWRNCRDFLSWIHNCWVLFKLTSKSTLAVGFPQKIGNPVAIQTKAIRTTLRLHPWKLKAGTWKYPEKRRTVDTNHQLLGPSIFGGGTSGVDHFSVGFFGGVGPFSTFWIAGHSDATCSGMRRDTPKVKVMYLWIKSKQQQKQNQVIFPPSQTGACNFCTSTV